MENKYEVTTKTEGNTGYFVQIPNKIFAFESEYFLSDDELLIFYTVGTMVSARNKQKVESNIELLNSKVNLGYSDSSKNKAKIRKALEGLHSKNYINLSYSDEKLTNTSLLDIFIPRINLQEKVRSGGLCFSGYEEIYDSLFETSKGDMKHFKVLIYTQWRSRIEFDIPYSQWAKVLGVCEKTAIKIIEVCIEAKLITKKLGQYYLDVNGQPRQGTNGYKINNDLDRDIEKGSSLAKKVNTAAKASLLSRKTTETRESNMFTNEFLEYKDYYIWKTTKCDVYKEHGKRRMDKFAEASFLIDKWEKRFIKEEKENANKRESIEAAQIMSRDFTDAKEYTYKPRIDKTDYSAILDDTPSQNNVDDDNNWFCFDNAC